MVILPDPFPAGTTVYADVTVWSTSKNDRGKFNIYIGETLIVRWNRPSLRLTCHVSPSCLLAARLASKWFISSYSPSQRCWDLIFEYAYRALGTNTPVQQKSQAHRWCTIRRSEFWNILRTTISTLNQSLTLFVFRLVDLVLTLPNPFIFLFNFFPHINTKRLFLSVPIPGGSYFVIKNDKGAQFMAFDAFEVAYCNWGVRLFHDF